MLLSLRRSREESMLDRSRGSSVCPPFSSPGLPARRLTGTVRGLRGPAHRSGALRSRLGATTRARKRFSFCLCRGRQLSSLAEHGQVPKFDQI